MFGFKSMKYPDKIFTKKIRIEKGNNNEEKDIFQNEETAFNINNKRYIFLFAQNFELIVRDQNNSEISKILSEQSNKESKINIEGIGMTISPYKEMEIDGYFRKGKFEVNMFDYNEIEVLFSNVKKEDEKYYIDCIIEAKLGANKVDELIKQIRKDHNLLKMKDIKNTILIGFINSIKIKNRNHFNSLDKKKCVIYDIKNSIFCGKEVTYQIDWDLEKRVKSINTRLDNIEKVFNDLKPKINKIYDYIIRKE